jgi:hypothetical protein
MSITDIIKKITVNPTKSYKNEIYFEVNTDFILIKFCNGKKVFTIKAFSFKNSDFYNVDKWCLENLDLKFDQINQYVCLKNIN